MNFFAMKKLFAFLILISSHQLFAQDIVFQGSFDAESRWTTFEGDWQIEKEGEKFFVVFSENFEAKKAPDLKIFLSKLPFKSIDGDNAADKDQAVLVKPLSAYEGSMKFEIPSTINVADFQSIIVHCEQYAKLWVALLCENDLCSNLFLILTKLKPVAMKPEEVAWRGLWWLPRLS